MASRPWNPVPESALTSPSPVPESGVPQIHAPKCGRPRSSGRNSGSWLALQAGSAGSRWDEILKNLAANSARGGARLGRLGGRHVSARGFLAHCPLPVSPRAGSNRPIACPASEHPGSNPASAKPLLGAWGSPDRSPNRPPASVSRPGDGPGAPRLVSCPGIPRGGRGSCGGRPDLGLPGCVGGGIGSQLQPPLPGSTKI